jgi:hypothetical protein
MFAPPSNAPLAGMEALVVAALMLGFGYLLADAVLARWSVPVDGLFRWGVALPALAAYTSALALIHIVTRGHVFSNAWLIRAVTLAVAAWLVFRRVRSRRAGRGEAPPPSGGATERRGRVVAWTVCGALLVGALILWGHPAFQSLPLNLNGDTPLHVAYAGQMMNGEATPSAMVTGKIPNAYPWMYHAFLAELARFTPGGRVYHAMDPLLFLLVAGAVLGLFVLGRELTGSWVGGAGATTFGAIAGSVHLVNPTSRMFLRPYNMALSNASPPFPRDLALTLLIGFFALLVAALERRRSDLLVMAGVVLGLTGLAGAESFFTGMGVAGLLWILPPTGCRRREVFVRLLAPAVAVYLVWLIPLLVSYLRYHGFVNITKVGPVNLTATQILESFGIVTPFAAWGFVRWAPRFRTSPCARVALYLLLVTAAFLLAASVIPGSLGESFLALGRRHRYWPMLYFALVFFGAEGVADIASRLTRLRHNRIPAIAVATAVAIGLVALSMPSSVHASSLGQPRHAGLVTESLHGDDTLLNRLLVDSGSPSGARCVVAAPLNVDMAVASYTGWRSVLFRWDSYKENLARIRWRTIYDHIPGDRERVAANRLLVTGRGSPGEWRSTAQRFGVDLVVVNAANASSPAFAGYPKEAVGSDWVIVALKLC